jgi:drug/metabolite transporter (DMT)-like permease
LTLLGLGNNALPFALIAWGQTHLAAGLASILNAATPLFAVLVAHVFTAEEKLSRFKIIGTAAGMVGVAWVIGPDLLWGQANVNAWAEGAVLLAALSYAVSAVFARRVRALGLEPLDVATGQATAGAIYLVPLALLLDQPWSLPVPSMAVVVDRRVLHGAGLCRLFPHSIWRGRDQCAAGDSSHPGDCGGSWRGVPA